MEAGIIEFTLGVQVIQRFANLEDMKGLRAKASREVSLYSDDEILNLLESAESLMLRTLEEQEDILRILPTPFVSMLYKLGEGEAINRNLVEGDYYARLQ